MSQLELVVLAAGVVALLAALGIPVARRMRSGTRRQRVLERLPDGVVAVFDRDLRFRYLAGAALRHLDLEPGEPRRLTLWDLHPQAEADALALHYRAALRGEARAFEYHSLRSGRDYWVRVAPLAEAGGEVAEGLALSIDVTDHDRATDGLDYRAADLDAVAGATRVLARSTDVTAARVAVCEGARQVAEAPIAALLEPVAGRSGLKATAVVGADLEGFTLALSDQSSGATRAFLRGEQAFTTADGVGRADREFLDRAGAVSVLWHPVLRDRVAIGVLALAWREPVGGISLRLSRLVDVLGAEAAVAIGRAELLARLEQLTLTDELTALPNRRAWEQELPRELARASRDERSICVAMLDLDRFKQYNDAYGHQAGDRLLRDAAAAWRAVLRRYDTLCRYGGEEFGVILPGCTLDQALPLIERLRSVTPQRQSCSAGVAEWDGDDPSALLGRADAALYRAKRSGRNQVASAPRIRD